MFSPKAPSLVYVTPNSLDSKTEVKRPVQHYNFFPSTWSLCRPEGASAICPVQCPGQSQNNFHVRADLGADCSRPCLASFWNLKRWMQNMHSPWQWSPSILSGLHHFAVEVLKSDIFSEVQWGKKDLHLADLLCWSEVRTGIVTGKGTLWNAFELRILSL